MFLYDHYNFIQPRVTSTLCISQTTVFCTKFYATCLGTFLYVHLSARAHDPKILYLMSKTRKVKEKHSECSRFNHLVITCLSLCVNIFISFGGQTRQSARAQISPCGTGPYILESAELL